MPVNIANAIAAYADRARNGPAEGLEARASDPGQSFADLLKDIGNSAVEAGKASEAVSAQAIAGKAELNDVVVAVSNAEVTLQTVLAVRDRVIQAYQDIVRMPI